MSNSEGLFWPLRPSCMEDPYIPRKETQRDLPKGVPRMATGKGIPFTTRFINEGEKYVDPGKHKRINETKEKKKRIQASPFIIKKSPTKVCPSDVSGTFSTSVYISDGKPYDWGPRRKITHSGPKQVLASAPAKCNDVPVKYIGEDYDRARKAELTRLAQQKAKEGPAFRVCSHEVFGQHPPSVREPHTVQSKRPQSAPARRAKTIRSDRGAFVPSGQRPVRSSCMTYVFDPYDELERKKMMATTSSRSLSSKIRKQERGDGKPVDQGAWRPTTGHKSKFTRSIAFFK